MESSIGVSSNLLDGSHCYTFFHDDLIDCKLRIELLLSADNSKRLPLRYGSQELR